MSKKELEATQEGKELLAIEELSQQLENYFKDSEQLKRENFLFESYFMRLEKEYKTDAEETTKKMKNRITQETEPTGTLSPEEKYEIAQQEAEALKDTIEKGRIKSDAILETLRVPAAIFRQFWNKQIWPLLKLGKMLMISKDKY